MPCLACALSCRAALAAQGKGNERKRPTTTQQRHLQLFETELVTVLLSRVVLIKWSTSARVSVPAVAHPCTHCPPRCRADCDKEVTIRKQLAGQAPPQIQCQHCAGRILYKKRTEKRGLVQNTCMRCTVPRYTPRGCPWSSSCVPPDLHVSSPRLSFQRCSSLLGSHTVGPRWHLAIRLEACEPVSSFLVRTPLAFSSVHHGEP
jgi:DNA-directed RNA polymerase subunit RPC12/RpoP